MPLALAAEPLPQNATPEQRRKWAQTMHGYSSRVLWKNGPDGPTECRIVQLESEHVMVKLVGGKHGGERMKARYDALEDWRELPKPVQTSAPEEKRKDTVGAVLEDSGVKLTVVDALKNPEDLMPTPTLPLKARTEKGWYIVEVKNKLIFAGSGLPWKPFSALDNIKPMIREGSAENAYDRLRKGEGGGYAVKQHYDKASVRKLSVLQTWELVTANGPVDLPDAQPERAVTNTWITQDADIQKAFTQDLRELKKQQVASFDNILTIKAKLGKLEVEKSNLLKELDEAKKAYMSINEQLTKAI